MAAEDEIKSVRESGESFLIWSVVLLLVVNLLIFPALTKDRKTVNQVIGNEVRRLNDQRILLERDLRRIEREISVLKEHPELGRARRFDQLGFNSDEGNLVQENIVSLSRVRKDV